MGRRGRHPDPNSKRSQAAIARAAAIGMAKPSTTPTATPTKCPKPPADVTARKTAAAFWKSHAESLAAAGRLRADNAEGLALLSHLYADCRDLAEQLAAEGWVTSTDKGQQANPVARLLRDARRDFVSLAREYGLTPAAETRFPPEAVDHAEEDAEEAALRAFCG
jgi:P27 family predicted phage terminase small subunit